MSKGVAESDIQRYPGRSDDGRKHDIRLCLRDVMECVGYSRWLCASEISGLSLCVQNRMSTPIQPIPLRVRFPNRYTGGYNSSTVTEKVKWHTIATVKKSRLNVNSDMGGETVIAVKTYPCCTPSVP
jgi:hypothetical protein